MQHSFWINKWENAEIGFHQETFHPAMLKYFPKLEPDSIVLVPLCGKSKDILWLTGQGYRVLGVELVESAVIEFFEENDLQYRCVQQGEFSHYFSDELPIQIIAGDFFKLNNAEVELCDALYDRAALVALPFEMRNPYAQQCLNLLKPAAKILLISFSYDQMAMQGPPFSIAASEIQSLWQGQLKMIDSFSLLQGESKFKDRGLAYMDEQTWSN